MSEKSHDKPIKPHKTEPEFEGPFWRHPYVLYMWLTALIFIMMIGISIFAFKSGCIPSSDI